MKLELLSLRLVGAGPLKDVTLDFSDGNGSARPVTLIAGANGSGKTTILEAIFAFAEVMKAIATRGDSELPSGNHNEITLKLDTNTFTLYYSKKRIEEVSSTDKIERVSLVDLTESFNKKNPKPSGVVQPANLTQPASIILATIAINESINNTSYEDSFVKINQAGLTLPGFIYLPYIRRLNRTDGASLVKEYTPFDFAYRYKTEVEYAGSLNSYLVWLEYAEPDLYKQAQEFIAQVYDNKKTVQIDRRRLKAVIHTGGNIPQPWFPSPFPIISKDDDSTHDIEYLSSGEQNLLIILLELQRRLTPHSIVLIDEIENSLHPKYQYKLGRMLKTLQAQTPFQLIATTHAPAFLDIFGAENTLILTEF